MTVAELIEFLQRQRPEAMVLVSRGGLSVADGLHVESDGTVVISSESF